MKGFLVVGIGFYHKKEKNWDGVGLSILGEVEIPKECPPLPLPEGVKPENAALLAMQAVENPNDGINPIQGFLLAPNREIANGIVRNIRDKIESGEFNPIRKNNENPIDEFITKYGVKDFNLN